MSEAMKPEKVWITKYWATTGVYVATGHLTKSGLMYVPAVRDHSYDQYFHGREFAMSEEDARKCVADLQKRKIASLEKQIAKIRAYEFQVGAHV